MAISVIHRFYSLFDYSIEIRIQSPTFTADLKRLGQLAHNGPLDAFRSEYQRACKMYGKNDPELIRLATFADFMSPEQDNCENGCK